MDFYIHSTIFQEVMHSAQNLIRIKFIFHKTFFRMSILSSSPTYTPLWAKIVRLKKRSPTNEKLFWSQWSPLNVMKRTLMYPFKVQSFHL